MARLRFHTAVVHASVGFAFAAVLILGSTDVARTASATFRGTNGKIVFSGLGSGEYDIFSMNADGSHLTDLSRNDATEHQPAGSPDGTKIAFSRSVDSDNAEIFVMNADGRSQRNLTMNTALDDFDPTWSPDGRKIAFTRCTKTDCDIYVMNADGSDQRDIVSGPGFAILPAWSPDETRIAYTNCCGPDVDNGIFVVAADGSGKTNLTSPSTSDSDPDWSPDGKRITFTRCTSATSADCAIYVMNADGRGVADLSKNPASSDMESRWSPDGRWLVFSRCVPFAGCNIAVMRADGSDQRSLTNGIRADLEPTWLAAPPQAACRVPNVVGMRLAAARQRIQRANCTVGRVRRVRSRRRAIVVAQSPRPGTRLPHGGRVNLAVGGR
jgi:Tol biopolymer transport system component